MSKGYGREREAWVWKVSTSTEKKPKIVRKLTVPEAEVYGHRGRVKGDRSHGWTWISGTPEGTIQVHQDLLSRKPGETIELQDPQSTMVIRSVDMSEDGKYLVATDEFDVVWIWHEQP